MENKHNLHPSVQQFKTFMKTHPVLIKEVKEGKRSLQDVYEEWSILGENHEQWHPFEQEQPTEQENGTPESGEKEPQAENEGDKKQASTTSEFLGQFMGLVKKMNVQDLQSHLTQFSSVLGNVQHLMQTFQKPQEPVRRSEQESPFSFRRD